VPLARWLRGPLRERVQDAVLGDQLGDTGMFDRRYLCDLVDRHQSGRDDCSAPLWALLMFEAFLRNLDAQPGAGGGSSSAETARTGPQRARLARIDRTG
jgi:asparagine synthase (glutamine-hydrolysing)